MILKLSCRCPYFTYLCISMVFIAFKGKQINLWIESVYVFYIKPDEQWIVMPCHKMLKLKIG